MAKVHNSAIGKYMKFNEYVVRGEVKSVLIFKTVNKQAIAITTAFLLYIYLYRMDKQWQ